MMSAIGGYAAGLPAKERKVIIDRPPEIHLRPSSTPEVDW